MAEPGQITVERLPDVVVVVLRGDHDVSTAPALRAELDPAMGTRPNLVVDLTEATFIDSTITSLLFRGAGTGGGILAIAVTPKTTLQQLIHTAGLPETVPTFESRDAAVTYATTGHT